MYPTVSQVTIATQSAGSALLRTKLYRPQIRADVLSRTRLIERLNGGLSGKVTLVCAPGGFGKTILLAQWLQTLHRPTAWLSLDDTDDELPVFVHGLTAALQSAVPDGFGATVGLLTAPRFPSATEVATLLSNDLADVPEDLLLVLDDYHLMHNRDIHILLELLITHLPPHVHLVLAARSEPPLPLARWLARGDLNLLGPADLRFTQGETEAFLTHVLGDELARESAGTLEERTDGWAALLRLAVLSLGSATHPAAFLERLRQAPDRSMSRYLLEEVLVQQPPAVQALLEQVSLLGPCCAELCVAIMGSAVSVEQVRATLDGLAYANVFLLPLDDRQGWYRLHHLFQGLLQQRLQEHSSPEELAVLHRRASTWYAEQGLINEALEQALAAGDAPYAARLVEERVLGAYEQEQQVQMERWLRLLPEEQVQKSPALLFATVWVVQADGQIANLPRLLSAAERLLAESDGYDEGDQERRALHALIAIGWSHFQYFSGQVQAGLQSARAALAWTPPAEAHLRSEATQYLAWSLQATGQEDLALATLNQALSGLTTQPTLTHSLLFAQGRVFLIAGKLHQAEQTARHLLQVAQQAGLAVSRNHAHRLLGLLYYEWNQLDEAVYHFSAVVADRHRAHFWAVRDAVCTLACAYQAQGLDEQARETADTLLDWVQDQQNQQEILTAYAFCGRLALAQDKVEEASRWLDLAGEQEELGLMMFFEEPAITRAWLLLARGDEASVAQAQAHLAHLLQHVEALHSTRKMIQVLALQAWAYDLQGREAEALDVLERALDLGRPGGFLRTFADLPKLSRVLHELRKRNKSRQVVDNTQDGYLQRILAAMHPLAAHTSPSKELLRQEGLEPLTERERHILALLDKDLANQEIAHELVITPGTVKVHINNLYRKLNVNNRRAAVSLARALGLLPAKEASGPPASLTSE